MRAVDLLQPRWLRRMLLAGLATLVFPLLPGRAEAGALVVAAGDCPNRTIEHPFMPWLDPASYVLAPDGAFSERGARWQRSGATLVPENEPYEVHGDDAPAALSLQEGAFAISPPMCVGLQHPTLRFFARNTGSLRGSLRVDVVFEDAAGEVRSLPLGLVTGQRAWAPTLPMPVIANLLPLLPGALTPVEFRFTAEGTSSGWLLDDVYVDPYGKG